jgi:glycosyltransferase involved in cell wall biosynthesis
MKLGFICEGTPNSYYRAIFPMRALEQRGHTVLWPREAEGVPMRELYECDLVHWFRRVDRIDDLRKLSARGVAISFDNDDNYAAAEVSYGGLGLKGHRYNQGIFRNVLKAARIADVTTTPNEDLADSYRAAGAENVVVIENHLDRGMFGFGSKSKGGSFVVGWVAGVEHELDLKRVPIADALARLLEVHSQLRVLTVGVPLPIRSDRYEHIIDVPFLDILKVTGSMDVGVAPLADTVFNRCRSNVKLKEYASGGTPWLASPVGPYLDLGEEQGGMLVADEGWLAAIDSLIRGHRLHKRLSKRALNWAKTQTIDRHVERWERTMLDAIERARRSRG